MSRCSISDTSENTPVPMGLLVDTNCICPTQSEKTAVESWRAGSRGSLLARWVGMLKLHFGLVKIRTVSIDGDFFEVYKCFQKKLKNKFKASTRFFFVSIKVNCHSSLQCMYRSDERDEIFYL